MRTVHLFAGAGGSLLAGDLLGWQHVTAAETDLFCRAVLAHRWPGVEILGDVRTEPWERFDRQVDLLAAGFPCQPVSSAGLRRASADHRDGWPATVRAIRFIGPRFVFLENVSAILTAESGRHWGRCLSDLAALGLDARWICLRASEVGAPHLRERLWCLAYSNGRGLERERGSGEPSKRAAGDAPQRGAAELANAASDGRGQGRSESAGQLWGPHAPERGPELVDPDMQRRERRLLPAGEGAGEPRGGAGAERNHAGTAESSVGRDADGLAPRLPWPSAGGSWPAGRGAPQEAWEPPRTIPRATFRNFRRQQLRALGNGWVPAQAVLAWRLLTGER